MTRYAAYALPREGTPLSPSTVALPLPAYGYLPSQPLRFAPAMRESRVAMLYAKYLGINGSLFELKVLSLQLMTVILQVCG